MQSILSKEPTKAQALRARAAVADLHKVGWRYKFYPFNIYGERVEIEDPGNKGRLDATTRAHFMQNRIHIEILTERSYELRRYGIRGATSDAASFLKKALLIFPGSRIHFS